MVLLGDGLRLFEHIDTAQIALEKIKTFKSGTRTDLWLCVIKRTKLRTAVNNTPS